MLSPKSVYSRAVGLVSPILRPCVTLCRPLDRSLRRITKPVLQPYDNKPETLHALNASYINLTGLLPWGARG